ncbi:MAG: hypothetical protein ACXU8O_04125 [Asticcacaulis sp.]
MIQLMLAFALSGAAVSPPPSPAASPQQENTVVAECTEWFAQSTFRTPTATKNLSDGLCFNGEIKAGDEKPFVDALSLHPVNQPLVIVVRSPGGDVDTGLSMGEVLVQRPVTVAAYQICGSACANFLMTAAKRRIVLKDALLLYHGSVTLDFLDSLAQQAGEQVRAKLAKDPNMTEDMIKAAINDTIEQLRVGLDVKIRRQDELLDHSGVSPTLFRWMNLYNHMTAEEQLTHCPVNTHMTVYPPSLLARFGFRMDSDGGPASQAELDRLTAVMKLDKQLCYWHE